MNMLEVIIIGGGPTGLNCALEAGKAGLNALVLEKGVLVNSIYHFPMNMTFFSTSRLLEIGDVPFISHAEKPTRSEALEYYRRIAEVYELDVRTYEGVEELRPLPGGGYEIRSEKGVYQTRTVIVATGFYDLPNQLDVPGEELPKVRHYYEDAHPYVGKKVLVVGAANSACDLALELYRKGAQVSMAIRGSEINPRVKYWIRPNIENRISEGSIQAFFHTRVKGIRPSEVELEGPEGVFTLENDFVLAMTGYRPNFAFLGRLGIRLSEDEACIPEHDPETYQTNLPGVYIAGVVCAGMLTSKLFIENTRDHAAVIVGDILRNRV